MCGSWFRFVVSVRGGMAAIRTPPPAHHQENKPTAKRFSRWCKGVRCGANWCGVVRMIPQWHKKPSGAKCRGKIRPLYINRCKWLQCIEMVQSFSGWWCTGVRWWCGFIGFNVLLLPILYLFSANNRFYLQIYV